MKARLEDRNQRAKRQRETKKNEKPITKKPPTIDSEILEVDIHGTDEDQGYHINNLHEV